MPFTIEKFADPPAVKMQSSAPATVGSESQGTLESSDSSKLSYKSAEKSAITAEESLSADREGAFNPSMSVLPEHNMESISSVPGQRLSSPMRGEIAEGNEPFDLSNGEPHEGVQLLKNPTNSKDNASNDHSINKLPKVSGYKDAGPSETPSTVATNNSPLRMCFSHGIFDDPVSLHGSRPTDSHGIFSPGPENAGPPQAGKGTPHRKATEMPKPLGLIPLVPVKRLAYCNEEFDELLRLFDKYKDALQLKDGRKVTNWAALTVDYNSKFVDRPRTQRALVGIVYKRREWVDRELKGADGKHQINSDGNAVDQDVATTESNTDAINKQMDKDVSDDTDQAITDEPKAKKVCMALWVRPRPAKYKQQKNIPTPNNPKALAEWKKRESFGQGFFSGSLADSEYENTSTGSEELGSRATVALAVGHKDSVHMFPSEQVALRGLVNQYLIMWPGKKFNWYWIAEAFNLHNGAGEDSVLQRGPRGLKEFFEAMYPKWVPGEQLFNPIEE